VKIVLKTQITAISFSVFWLLYINILVFFDQPGPRLEHINWFVNGFAAFFGVLVMVVARYFFGGKWFALPLVLIPEWLIYQPLLESLFSSLVSKGYQPIFRFLALSTGTIYLIAVALGLIMGIMFGRFKKS
jgi:hypothetical protein